MPQAWCAPKETQLKTRNETTQTVSSETEPKRANPRVLSEAAMISGGASEVETGRISSKGRIKEPWSRAPTVTFTFKMSRIKWQDYMKHLQACNKSVRSQCRKSQNER